MSSPHLKTLTDDALHNGNIQSAREEREVLTRNLHRLRETERRRLFSKYKCKSLFAYAAKFMKYSNDQADRRIKAMRLLRDFPVIEEKINDGALNLTNLALAQKLFDLEKKSGSEMTREQKSEVLHRLENKTTREAEKVVFEIKPEMKTRKNELNFGDIEDDRLREKLLEVKGLFAHTDPGLSLTDLLHKLCDQALEKKTKTSRAPKMNSNAEIAREVWRRDGRKCRNCGSTHALQIEHIKPKAAGGGWTLDNLCLLCRSCNQRSAIEFYGAEKMAPYLRSPFVPYAAS
jgi:hypothetical protein